MQIIDTFSGIGGFSLAGRWMGWETVQFCEIDPFCQKVLAHHWPGVPIHNDIKTLTADMIRQNGLYDESEPTIFVGGVPCQPWSAAGKRLGKDDERDLWQETITLLGQIKPDWAVLENVHGLVNWNGGMVFDEVQTELEAEGYEVTTYILPAAAVNAPHRRDRVWFVAYCKNKGSVGGDGKQGNDARFSRQRRVHANGRRGDVGYELTPHTERNGLRNHAEPEGQQPGARRTARSESSPSVNGGDVADTKEQRFSERYAESIRNGTHATTQRHGSIQKWQNFPTQSPVCSRNDGISSGLDGITFPKWRNESIKAAGNAIVPQVAYQLFKTIELYERQRRQTTKHPPCQTR